MFERNPEVVMLCIQVNSSENVIRLQEVNLFIDLFILFFLGDAKASRPMLPGTGSRFSVTL